MDHLNVFVFFIFITTLHSHGVTAQMTSEEEDIEFKRQLTILNKPAIKIIQTKDGVYDCVDIYKQPALDHHLLKDHKIQMLPTFELRPLADQSSSTKMGLHSLIMGIDCPSGTIPIKRTQKKDLIRAKYLSKIHASGINPHSTNFPRRHVSVLRTDMKTSSFHGAHAFINVYGLNIKDDQHSAAQLFIDSSFPGKHATLQAGWVVSEKINGRQDTYLFAFWAREYPPEGCFNQLCSGFVQVDRSIVPGSRIAPLSTYGGEQREIEITIHRDNITGNWWLHTVGKPIGYWPKELVPQLDNGASTISWGGLVKGPADEDSPPMGNGHYPPSESKACYIRDIYTIDAFDQIDIPNKNDVEVFVDTPTCYGLENRGYIKDLGYLFFLEDKVDGVGCKNYSF